MDFWGRMASRALVKAPMFRWADPIIHDRGSIATHRLEDQLPSPLPTPTLPVETPTAVTHSRMNVSLMESMQQVRPEQHGEIVPEDGLEDQGLSSPRVDNPLPPISPVISSEDAEPAQATRILRPGAGNPPVADPVGHEIRGSEIPFAGPPPSEIQHLSVSPIPESISREVEPGVADQPSTLVQATEASPPISPANSIEEAGPATATGIPRPSAGNPPVANPVGHEFRGDEIPVTGPPPSEIQHISASPLPESASREVEPEVADQASTLVQKTEPLSPISRVISFEEDEPAVATGISLPGTGNPPVANLVGHEFRGDEIPVTAPPKSEMYTAPMPLLPASVFREAKPGIVDRVPGSLSGQSVAETGSLDYLPPRALDLAVGSENIQRKQLGVSESNAKSVAHPSSRLIKRGEMAGFGPIRDEMDGVINQAIQRQEASQSSASSQIVAFSARQRKESNSSAPISNLDSISGRSGMVRGAKVAPFTKADGLPEILNGEGEHGMQSRYNPNRPLLDAQADETNPITQGIPIPARQFPPPAQVSAITSPLGESITATSPEKHTDGKRIGRAAFGPLEKDANHDYPTKPRGPAMVSSEEKARPPTVSHPPASIVTDQGAVTTKLVSPEHDERTFVAEALTRIPDPAHGWIRRGERIMENSPIEVLIDSIEIISQTVQPSTEPVDSYEPAAPALSLDSYLQQRDEGAL